MKLRWWEAWTPVVAVVIAALLGLVGYSYEKSLDRGADLQKLKREAYTLYLESFHYLIDGHHSGTPKYVTAIENLFLIASDEVLREVGQLHKLVFEIARRPNRGAEDGLDELAEVLTNLYKAMRDDGFYPVELSDSEVTDLIQVVARYRFSKY